MSELKLYAYRFNVRHNEILVYECTPEVKPATYVIPKEKEMDFGIRKRISTNEINCVITRFSDEYIIYSEDGDVEKAKALFKETITEKHEKYKKEYERWNKCVSDFEKVGVVKCE